MACSKLFSGDLPEISIYIIQNLRNDINTLHNIALLNRFWFRLAIPFLWEDPFSVKYQENSSHFLDTYFLFLNEDDKNKLKEIKPYKFEHKPLFNYPSLIKTLNFQRVQLHVGKWFNSTSRNNTTSAASATSPLIYLQNEPTETVYCHRNDDEKLKVICVSLFKLFVENNASLNNLYINDLDNKYHFFYHICDMILKNPKFISDIEILSFNHPYHWPLELILINPKAIESIQSLFSSLPSLSASIKHIDFSSDKLEFNKFLANIVQSQSQLSSVKLSFPEILDSLKHSSNTLTSITFYSCYFSDTMNFDALSYLTRLESLQFRYCNGLISRVIKPLLNITIPLKIKTFVITDELIESSSEKITSIQLLIQRIGAYIENLFLSICEDELREIIFDTIIEFCEKIKFLHLNCIDVMNISQLPQMISKFNNYLEYFTLEIKIFDSISNLINNLLHNANNDITDNSETLSSTILKEISTLPSSLHYLDLKLAINPDDLKIFLENYNQTELKKLLIRNRSKDNVDTTLKVIKDFVKEKNLEFLAYCIGNNVTAKGIDLEKLVEETQSFVKMMKYDDLALKVSNFDGTLKVS